MWLAKLLMQLFGLPLRRGQNTARLVLLFLMAFMPLTFVHVTQDMFEIAAQQADAKALMIMGVVEHSLKLPVNSAQPFPTFKWPSTTTTTTTTP